MKIAVLGAGAWGTAMAVALAQRHTVSLWTRDPAHAARMRAERSNEKYLARVTFPPALAIFDSDEEALAGAGLALVAVATAGLRDTLRRVAGADPAVPVVWLCKGFEPGSGKLPHEVCRDELDASSDCAALSGPSFAEEVARGLPTAVTLASARAGFARDAARALHGPAFRVYSSDDLVGVEVAGAVKNVIAIAAGICDGLGYGHNARAAVITRGLAEVSRLGVALGGRTDTFMGLAGAGDLILTCTGDLSRNRRVGLKLASGQALAEILTELGHVAEGVNTAQEVERLADRLGVDMPITAAVVRVLRGEVGPRAAADELLRREPKAER